MPRMTRKYRAALTCARDVGLQTDVEDQDTLYAGLMDLGYHWDPDAGGWEYHDPDQAHDPLTTVRIRVWAALDMVDLMVDDMLMSMDDFKLVSRSKVYPCRPPNQKEGRVYLVLLPPPIFRSG